MSKPNRIEMVNMYTLYQMPQYTYNAKWQKTFEKKNPQYSNYLEQGFVINNNWDLFS